MKTLPKILLILFIVLLTALALLVGAGIWHARGKLPQRSGWVEMRGLQSPVQVRYDERGVPHLQAHTEADLYRALGYVHAQDRLFQMEMIRRLARGELAEVLGPKLLETDRLFRTLGLRAHAEERIKTLNPNHPSWRALLAYLEGVNSFQESRPLPIEFEILGITPQPFTPVDVLAVTGYLGYSFAAAFRTEPALSFIRDQLGPDHLRIFRDQDWLPLGVLGPEDDNIGAALSQQHPQLSQADWQALARLADTSLEVMELAGQPLLEGSNAWAISGRRTASGKPILAGDPHISFALPAVWYEAHLRAPGFELYGHFHALLPFALLGHNQQFGWSLTMFQNDDMDLVTLHTNPANPGQVWQVADVHGPNRWANIVSRREVIAVKNQQPDVLDVQVTPQGPIINRAFPQIFGGTSTPIALWWTFLQTENPLLEAFYELNRADTLPKARQAASKVHSPGLNIVWANARGDIAWWAAAKLVQRPIGVNPAFILDGGTPQASKPGYYRFEDNPQEENPARGHIMSANHQPTPKSGLPVHGYYNLQYRARRLESLLQSRDTGWTQGHSMAMQLDDKTDYGPRLIAVLRDALRTAAQAEPDEQDRLMETTLVDQLTVWDGAYNSASVAATIFTQLQYELAYAAMSDEMGALTNALLRSRAIDMALLRLARDEASPWWDDRRTPQVENRGEIVQRAWRATVAHLRKLHGRTLTNWAWGRNHTLTHKHPLGNVKPLNLIFDAGPFQVGGGREVPNNISHSLLSPAPWAATYGPSTRRVIDFGAPGQAQGINPVGQSGVLLDAHYADQAPLYAAGRTMTMHLDPADVSQSTRSVLVLQPPK